MDYDSLSDVLEYYAKKSYEFRFEAEFGALFSPRLGIRFTPDEFDVVDVRRFIETESKNIERLVYLISSLGGIRGTLVLSADDVYLQDMTFEMAQKLRMDPFGEWICS